MHSSMFGEKASASERKILKDHSYCKLNNVIILFLSRISLGLKIVRKMQTLISYYKYLSCQIFKTFSISDYEYFHLLINSFLYC